MKLIIPMAGMGKRMRPHTLNTPKPLLKLNGKPIVQLLIEEIADTVKADINEIGFVIGDFGKEVELSLLGIAESVKAKGKIYYQDEPLGTAHAVHCARESLDGPVIVAFADTLFKSSPIKIDKKTDSVTWVKEVDNPSQYGVVFEENGMIKKFVEKPREPISNLAIIGIYYFAKGEDLRAELDYLIENKVVVGKEYQLTTALENMISKGNVMKSEPINTWMDCGNKDETIKTNKQLLSANGSNRSFKEYEKSAKIVEPCYIGKNVKIINSVVGPYVSIGDNSEIFNSVISNSIIQENTVIENRVIEDSMIGNFVKVDGKASEYNIGDYCVVK